MTTEANKQVIREYFDAVNRRDGAAILQLLTSDFVLRGKGRHPDWMRFVWGREAFADAPREMSTKMKKPLIFNLGNMTAEGNRVAVEADSYGEMLNGKIYDNAYHFVFIFSDGKIREVLEYCCTYTAFTVFGEFVDPPPVGANAPS